MIFHLGKTKTSDEESVRQETFKRWREASLRAQPEPDNGPVEATGSSDMPSVQWPDPRATISLTREMESDSTQLEIPDSPPLAAPEFSVSTPNVSAATPLSAPVPISPPPLRAAPKSTTSKLAQFVSSGLNATGLLGAAPKPTPLPVPQPTPQPTPQPVRPVEGVRVLEAVRNDAERKPAVKEEPPSPDDDIKRRFGTNVRSALGPGTIIEGTFSFDSPVCIEGTLIGEVRSNSVLIVGAQAMVNAKVKVGSLIVLGTVKGDVESEELVEIKAGGSLEGDVISERFAIEDGGWFQGRCTPTTLQRPQKAPTGLRPTVEAGLQSETVLVGDEPFVQRARTADSWTME